MKRRNTWRASIIRGAVAALLLSGCTSTLMVGEDPAGGRGKPLTYQHLHDRLQGKHVRMILRDGRRVPGTVLAIAQDSVRLEADSLEASLVVPTSTVLCIEKIDRTDGAFLGFLGGGLGGMALAGGIASATKSGGGDMSGLGPAFAAIGGGTLGAIGGTLFGAIHGIVTRYEFPVDTVGTHAR